MQPTVSLNILESQGTSTQDDIFHIMFYCITFQGYFTPQDWGWQIIPKSLTATGIQAVTSHISQPLVR